MSMVKIFSTKQSRANKKTNVFLDGKKIVLSWDAECTSEIDELLLVELLKTDSSIQILDKQVKDKVEATLIAPEDVIKLKERIGELENENQKLRDENEQLKSALSQEEDVESVLRQMTLVELKEFAKENNLPEEDWKDFKVKKSLIEYLLDKVKHQ